MTLWVLLFRKSAKVFKSSPDIPFCLSLKCRSWCPGESKRPSVYDVKNFMISNDYGFRLISKNFMCSCYIETNQSICKANRLTAEAVVRPCSVKKVFPSRILI